MYSKTIIYANPFCTQLEVTRKEASKESPQKKWMNQLENLTQERDRLTGDVITLKDQLVSMKREVKYLILIWYFHSYVYEEVNPGYPFCTQLEVTRKKASKESSAVKALKQEFATVVAKKDEVIRRISDDIRGLKPIADQYRVLFAEKKELQVQFDAMTKTHHAVHQMLRELQDRKAAADSRVKELTMVVGQVTTENEILNQQNSQLKQQNEVRMHLIVAVYIESIYVCSDVQA